MNISNQQHQTLAAVAWDMDGTLLNSEPIWERITYELSESLGKRLTPELQAKTVGGSFRNTVAIAAHHAGVVLTETEFEDIQRECYTKLATRLPYSKIFPGIRSCLQSLREAKIPIAVVTNTARELAIPALRGLGVELFDAIVCGDDISVGKPNPLGYQTACAHLSVLPSTVLVFEDSQAGMAAGLAAGCRVLAAPGAQLPLPQEVHAMPQASFVGVTAPQIQQWFAELSTQSHT
ncbi:HAD family phosphatase [Corynebacterium sp. HS2168-gen11]|uniref:HAD family hydrolase n=1 Tax=Corynebacterium sp. HS2168-gen11 TaxID=2974027 RepID=UPI00216B0EE7|nr:HAD family phosphatase [Corynebacterium sp. HS2168-gen11]MCS4535089.1 HAD family phosphatase [Corynebacterium sp. HS2168-gen11]